MKTKPNPRLTANTIKAVNVVELLAEGEGDAVIIGIRSFPDTKDGIKDAKALFKAVVKEYDDSPETDETMTAKQLNDVVKRGHYAHGTYIAKIYVSIHF